MNRRNQGAVIDTDRTVLALDVGDRRIGVSIANLRGRLPQPWGALDRTADLFDQLDKLIADHRATALVIGLPRGLDGQVTAQTTAVQEFAEKELRPRLKLPLYYQDEALTSKLAEEELAQKKVTYNKSDVDALAATYILTDFLNEHPEVK